MSGESAKAALSNLAVHGEPEEQLRSPLKWLIEQHLAPLCGMSSGAVTIVGETPLPELGTRPDFAVTNKSGLVGHIEIKSPGKGADPRKFKSDHD